MPGTPRPTLFVFATLTVLTMQPGHTQISPATLPATIGQGNDAALSDYLKFLGQIAPAAEEGARTYLAAVRLRCRRMPAVDELRRAVSEGGGNPVLMGLIGAAHQQDVTARTRLIGQIQCGAAQ